MRSGCFSLMRLSGFCVAAVFAALSLGCGDNENTDATKGPSGSLEDQREVARVFEAYRDALLKKEGEVVAQHVSVGTLELYDGYRRLALTGSEPEVRSLSISDRFLILSIRSRMSAQELSGMDGRRLFVHAVNEGWFGEYGLEHRIGDVAAGRQHATGVLLGDKKPTKTLMSFTREEDGWKLQLLSHMAATDDAMREMARYERVSEDEFIMSLVSAHNGKQATEDLWKPLAPASGSLSGSR